MNPLLSTQQAEILRTAYKQISFVQAGMPPVVEDFHKLMEALEKIEEVLGINS